MTDAAAFRAEFPVFDRLAFLNAGSEGPMPRAAADAAQTRIRTELECGRGGKQYFEGVLELCGTLRERCARVFGCDFGEVALTGSTTDGVNVVVGGFPLEPGDEIVTTDEEHPGVLAPLASARRRRGVTIRVVPWEEIPNAVSARTRLIACSHVSWVSGRLMDVGALVATGVPVLLDGAQALGAIPVDVRSLGCDFYAAPGQKWLCGPSGSGALFVRRDRVDQLETAWPGFASLADHEHPLESAPADGASRFDVGFPAAVKSTWMLASLDLLEQAGWDWVHERGPKLAAMLAEALAARGLDVLERGPTTLVSWRSDDPVQEVARLLAEGIVVRSIPGGGLVRASMGAWCSEADMEALAGAVFP